jgi:hypothetical protein
VSGLGVFGTSEFRGNRTLIETDEKGLSSVTQSIPLNRSNSIKSPSSFHQRTVKMSSWWSALNPFVEVKAEEAQDDKEEEEAKDGGDDEGNPSNSPSQLIQC